MLRFTISIFKLPLHSLIMGTRKQYSNSKIKGKIYFAYSLCVVFFLSFFQVKAQLIITEGTTVFVGEETFISEKENKPEQNQYITKIYILSEASISGTEFLKSETEIVFIQPTQPKSVSTESWTENQPVQPKKETKPKEELPKEVILFVKNAPPSNFLFASDGKARHLITQSPTKIKHNAFQDKAIKTSVYSKVSIQETLFFILPIQELYLTQFQLRGPPLV